VKSVALSGVDVRFGAVHALNDVSVDVNSGEIMMMVGPNGAGKTTLARVLLGLVRPRTGTLSIDGVDQSNNTELKKNLGYLPEAVAFSDNLKGRQVLRFFAWARGVHKKRIDAALDRVGLAHAAKRSVRGYSRGMRQRLGLAVAILAEPDLLILDEPTGGLDNEGLAVLWSILDEWRDANRMVILASHQLALLERRVDRVCVFKSGKVIAEGSPKQLRDTAGLRHRVIFDLQGNGSAEAVCAEAASLTGVETQRVNGSLVVDLAGDDLLSLMDVRGNHRDAVTGLRIIEPTLDMVYQELLEQADR
jgi:Cu-processing system ATP-binding protein